MQKWLAKRNANLRTFLDGMRTAWDIYGYHDWIQQRSIGSSIRGDFERVENDFRSSARKVASDCIYIRFAERADVPLILEFIEGLAEYEKLRHECVATEALLEETLFGAHPAAEVLLAFDRRGAADRPSPAETPVGFALFFHSYSTFLARPGIWLEDLFVVPEARGRGYGKALLARLAELAVERRCGRLEWAVLDWNTPAIEFYESIGAEAQDEWTTYRVTGAALGRLSEM